MLSILSQPGIYQELEKKTAVMFEGLIEAAGEAGVPVSGNQIGSMFGLFFTDHQVTDYKTATKAADTDRYAAYWRHMLDAGVWLAPSQFEVAFCSTAHTPGDLDQVLSAAREAFKAVA